MLYRAYLLSGCYTIEAADDEEAAMLALSLSKATENDYLLDVEPYGGLFPKQYQGSKGPS